MIMQELRETRGADFLFALNQEGDAQREVRTALKQTRERGNCDEVWSLVIRGATSPDLTVAHDGLKSGRRPEIQRVGWLHVIMTI